MIFSEINENLTITMDAECGINILTEDRVTVNYIVQSSESDNGNSTNEDNETVQQPEDEETHRAEFWNNSLHCHGDDVTGIDDYNTTEFDNHICILEYEYNWKLYEQRDITIVLGNDWDKQNNLVYCKEPIN